MADHGNYLNCKLSKGLKMNEMLKAPSLNRLISFLVWYCNGNDNELQLKGIKAVWQLRNWSSVERQDFYQFNDVEYLQNAQLNLDKADLFSQF